MKRLLALLSFAVCTTLTWGGEAEVKKAWESTFTEMKVDSVTKADYLGLYEVYAEGEIFYTDEKLTAILHGELIDAKTRKNITLAHKQKLTAIKFSDLPLASAVKQVRGNGKRVFATFEDPNCGYCKRLAKDMATLDNATIYTFLYPILSPDSAEKSGKIWCAPDRAKAWTDWMTQGKEPPAAAAGCDSAAISKNVALGRKLSVTGTPTIIFANGERVSGALPLADLEQKLTSSTN
jgi:thiol:disulfide interchange protein DsbC